MSMGIGRSRRTKGIMGLAAGYLAMALVAACIFAPLYWLLVSSITTKSELLSVPIHWIPWKVTLKNYVDIIIAGPRASEVAQMFKGSLANSFVVAGVVTLLALALGSPAAYAFARLEFPGRRAGLILIIVERMLPAVALIIPLYLLASDLPLLGTDLRDTKLILIILYLSFTLPFSIWLMASFFQSIPTELEEAARLDGCNRLGALARVILPASLPGLIATGIFTFMTAWDEFFFALIFTSSPAAKTVPVAIAEFTGRYAIDYSAMTTGGVLAAIPPVLLALVFQRYVVSGMTAGAVKG